MLSEPPRDLSDEIRFSRAFSVVRLWCSQITSTLRQELAVYKVLAGEPYVHMVRYIILFYVFLLFSFDMTDISMTLYTSVRICKNVPARSGRKAGHRPASRSCCALNLRGLAVKHQWVSLPRVRANYWRVALGCV